MTSIKLKYRPSTIQGKEGTLFYQIIHNRTLRRISTRHHIYNDEWCTDDESIIIPNEEMPRKERLIAIRNDIQWDIKRFNGIVVNHPNASLDELISTFEGHGNDGRGVFDYLRKQSERLKSLGRIRGSETMRCTLCSFMRFRGFIDISFNRIDKNVIEQYEAYLKSKGLKRNTSSFYMRILRTAYKQAVEDGLTADNRPFHKVYTGIDKTNKRAVSFDDIKRIKNLDLSDSPLLDFARNMFLFSFYARGMSFVDMAFLRKTDAENGFIYYHRRKTGQYLSIEVVPQIQAIVFKYASTTQYLLPLITREDGTERRQYQNQLLRINRSLKKVGEMAGLSIPLSTYVSRHSWATIARDRNVPLAVISEGLGHDNETTTQIYLDSICSTEVDKANRIVLKGL